jgi:hypothetical protein
MDIRKISASGAALAVVVAAWVAGCAGSGSDAPPASQSPVAQQPGKPSGAARAASLAVGDNVPAFDVKTISGELKGQTLCYV